MLSPKSKTKRNSCIFPKHGCFVCVRPCSTSSKDGNHIGSMIGVQLPNGFQLTLHFSYMDQINEEIDKKLQHLDVHVSDDMGSQTVVTKSKRLVKTNSRTGLIEFFIQLINDMFTILKNTKAKESANDKDPCLPQFFRKRYNISNVSKNSNINADIKNSGCEQVKYNYNYKYSSKSTMKAKAKGQGKNCFEFTNDKWVKIYSANKYKQKSDKFVSIFKTFLPLIKENLQFENILRENNFDMLLMKLSLKNKSVTLKQFLKKLQVWTTKENIKIIKKLFENVIIADAATSTNYTHPIDTECNYFLLSQDNEIVLHHGF